MADRLILVTGGSGYVGSVLVPFLARMGHKVRVLETLHFGNPITGEPGVEFVQGDITDEAKVRETMQGVTDVVHLAGIVTDDLVDMNRDLATRVNVQATVSLLRAARDAGAKRFIYASSSSVYGTQPEGVDATEETPPRPMTYYAETKLLAEEVVLLGNTADFTTSAIRSATCAGPAPRMRADTVVNVFSVQAWFKGRITVHGGAQWRSNIHVRDIATLYANMLRWPAEKIGGRAFNATRENMTALDIAHTVERLIPFSKETHAVKVEVDGTREDTRHYRMDASRLKRELGWQPVLSISDAIRDNLDFFKRGGITNPDDPIYRNTDRMRAIVEAAKGK